jgi:tellurite resistance protein
MSDDWSYAHDLVNMYLGIAQLADNELDPQEQKVLLEKFREWMPHLKTDQFEDIWGEVRRMYDSLESRENRHSLFLQSTLNVAQLMGGDREQLECILKDLVDIAAADGEIRDSEVTMIKAAAYAYGFYMDVQIDQGSGQASVALQTFH